jgi:hypothetical protein
VFGAVLSSRLIHYLAEAFAATPAGARAGGGAGADANNIQAIQHLAEPVKGIVLGAFAKAIDDVFLVGVPFIVVAFVVSLFLKEIPLQTGAAPGGEAVPAVPGAGEAEEEAELEAEEAEAGSEAPTMRAR